MSENTILAFAACFTIGLVYSIAMDHGMKFILFPFVVLNRIWVTLLVGFIIVLMMIFYQLQKWHDAMTGDV